MNTLQLTQAPEQREDFALGSVRIGQRRAFDTMRAKAPLFGIDGLETTVQAKALYPDLKILILTMYNTHEFISNLVKAGADGYILKNTGKDELLKAIRQVMSGQNFFSTAITTTLVSGIRNVSAYRRLISIP